MRDLARVSGAMRLAMGSAWVLALAGCGAPADVDQSDPVETGATELRSAPKPPRPPKDDPTTFALATSRVSAGLVASYDFEETQGAKVLDVSGVAPRLDLTIENPTRVSRGAGTLSVNQATRITSSSSASKIISAVKASGEITVEAWIRPRSTTQTAPARIVSISQSSSLRDVTLDQGRSNGSRTAFDVHFRTTRTNSNGDPSLTTSSGVVTTNLTQVVYTRQASGVDRIYVNGVLRKSDSVNGNTSNWASYPLVLANEIGSTRAWLGTYHLVAFYGRALAQSEIAQNFAAGPNDAPAPPNEAPLASLVATPTTGNAPLTVSFDASGSSDGDGAIAGYAWSFGDGATSTLATPSHTYASTGTYAVTLTVTDDDGATAQQTTSIVVTNPAPTNVQFALTATAASSSSVQLAWPSIAGATGITVYAGPEPAATNGSPLPLETTVATLPGNATGMVLSGVAAKTSSFFRVVATTATGTAWGTAWAKTPGGPRATLDTALRSVHLLSPTVLELVLETKGVNDGVGARGVAWQSGVWGVVRENGAVLPVTAVRRQSIPVAQPSYFTTYNQFPNDKIVDVDDRVFLVLAEPVGSRAMLRVSHAGGGQGTDLVVTVPVSDSYLETPLVKLNQLGYNPRATQRYAYFSGYLGDGGPLDLANLPQTVDVIAEPLDPLRVPRVVQGALAVAPRASVDDEAGGQVKEVDLRTVPAAEGVRYRVRVPGVGVSYPTAVSEEAALRAFYAVARGMFHNRYCGNLAVAYTDWSRPPDHCSAYFVTGRRFSEGFFPQTTPKTDLRPLVGGHHDAGDFDIRPYHVVVAQYLMRAYEQSKTSFFDGQLDLPESGNGIPDLLDEALWSVAGWQALQNPDGSVRAGVESWANVRGIYFASDDQLPYWTYEPESWHTAYVAALFAQAAYLVRPFDPARADALLTNATTAYAWAQSHSAPEEYLFFAAGELARATGEASYKTAFESLWTAMGPDGPFQNFRAAQAIFTGSFISNTPVMPDFLTAYAELPSADTAKRARISFELLKLSDAQSNYLLTGPHSMRNARPATQRPDWGTSASTGRHVDGLYQARQSANPSASVAQKYFDMMSLSADYALGGNPEGMVYLTGLGTIGPEQILHNDSLAFVKARGLPQIPGLPVFGPIFAAPGSTYFNAVKASFYPAFNDHPLCLRYADTRAAVNTNEFSVWESQAPMVELFAVLAPPQMPPPTWKPGQPGQRWRLTAHTSD